MEEAVAVTAATGWSGLLGLVVFVAVAGGLIYYKKFYKKDK